MSDFNLCDVVDLANECGGNPYWAMSEADKQHFRDYAKDRLRARRPATVAEQSSASTVKESDDVELDNIIAVGRETDTEETVHEDHDENNRGDASAEASSEEVVLGDGALIAPVEDSKTKGREKSKRWLEYVKCARESLVQSGSTKPTAKQCHELARTFLAEDGWL